jgi:hypothetical protein
MITNDYHKNYYLAHRDQILIKHRQYRIKNRDKILARQAKNRGENRAKLSKLELDRYYANRDKFIIRITKYREANPDKVKVWRRNWNQAHPDKNRVYHQNRRAREKGNGGSFTLEDEKELFNSQNGLCAWCEQPLFNNFKNIYHKHHKMPLIRGGTNYILNIELVHHDCHKSELHKQRVDEFLKGEDTF